MLDGPSVVSALVHCGVTHVVWIPDSFLGTWEESLTSSPGIELIRVSREGEAFAVAAGLLLGGKNPIVVIQCTGFFEAGDSFRNVVHDLKLPLFSIVGLRSYNAHQKGTTKDSCPLFAEPIFDAWKIPYVILKDDATAEDLAAAFRQALAENRAGAALLAE